MTFDEWMKNADIPHYDEVRKEWVDLETGLSFAEEAKRTYTQYTPSSETKELRKFARQFGGKALSGTAKQKNWAEKIRAEKLQEMSPIQAHICCKITRAADWIERRNKNVQDIFEEVNTKLKKIAHNNNVTREYKKLMETIGVGKTLTSEQSEKLREIEAKYI